MATGRPLTPKNCVAPRWRHQSFVLTLSLIFGALAITGRGDNSGTTAVQASVSSPESAQATVEPQKTLPFELYRNLIFLPVRINGSKPYSFVLDSGSGDCLIDLARAKRSEERRVGK